VSRGQRIRVSGGALSGLTSTLLFQPCTSLPSCASCPSSRSDTSRPHKDASSAGRCLLRTKSALPVLMRTNLTLLSVQSSRCHSLHHAIDRLFLRGTRSLARHIRIVNPVHSFASSFRFLTGCLSCMWILITRVPSNVPGIALYFTSLSQVRGFMAASPIFTAAQNANQEDTPPFSPC
jgi:hypothetical protein